MISSPCRDCINKNQSKDKCLYDCKALQEIQSTHLKMRGGVFSNTVDSTEEDRHTILLSSGKAGSL